MCEMPLGPEPAGTSLPLERGIKSRREEGGGMYAMYIQYKPFVS
jgi:hypothetical protein